MGKILNSLGLWRELRVLCFCVFMYTHKYTRRKLAVYTIDSLRLFEFGLSNVWGELHSNTAVYAQTRSFYLIDFKWLLYFNFWAAFLKLFILDIVSLTLFSINDVQKPTCLIHLHVSKCSISLTGLFSSSCAKCVVWSMNTVKMETLKTHLSASISCASTHA